MASNASAWGNQVGGWRCGVSASVEETGDDTARVTVSCLWQPMGAWYQVDYCEAYVASDGVSLGEPGVTARSGFGGASTTEAQTVLTRSWDVARGENPRDVRVAASFVMPDVSPGASYAEAAVTVPARRQYAPLPPESVSASLAGSAVALTWASASDPDGRRPWTSVEVSAEADGSPLAGYPATLRGDATSASLAAPANLRVDARVRSANSAGASAWVAADPVYTAPPAPTGVVAEFIAAESKVEVRWASSARHASGFDVERSSDGGRTWVRLGTADRTAAADWDPPEGSSRYRVRAVVPGGAASAWSSSPEVSTFTTEDYPTVAITSPSSVVRYRPVEVSWEASPGSGDLAGFEVELSVGGAAVERVSAPASARSATLSASALPDGGSAVVTVTAGNSLGLSAPASLAVTADYWPPAPPLVSAIVDLDTLSVVLSVRQGASSQASPAVSFDVERSSDGGGLATVASGLAAGEVRDPVPPLNSRLAYRVTAFSADGKSASAEVGACVEAACGAVTFDGGSTWLAALDLEVSETASRGGAAYHFADGGASGGLPTWYGSPDLDSSWSVSFALPPSDVAGFRADARSCGTAWFRDPLGRVVHAHPAVSVESGAGCARVSVSMTEVS